MGDLGELQMGGTGRKWGKRREPKNGSKRGQGDLAPNEEKWEGVLCSGESTLAPGLSFRPLTSLFPKSIQNTE